MIRHKFITALCCLFTVLTLNTLHAQEAVKERMYNFDSWRVLFQMNGPNNWQGKINFVKPVHAKWAIRFGMNPIISFNRTIGENPNTAQYSSYTSTNRNKKMGAELAFGAEYHFMKKGKIDPYMFFGVGVGGFKESSKVSRSYTLIAPASDGLLEYERTDESKSAPQLSIDPFIGFGLNYFFHERVAFGIEYSCSPNMILNKGNTTTTIEESRKFDDGTEVTDNSSLEVKRNAFFVQANPQIGFHLIYVFENKKK